MTSDFKHETSAQMLWQTAFYDNSENVSPLFDTSLGTHAPADPGDNLLSLSPLKHRNFKLCAAGKGPVGPQKRESMVLCSELQLLTHPTFRTMHRLNLTP